MAWIYLFIAGLLEIGWAIGLKYTEGWTRLYPSLLTAATMIASFYFLSRNYAHFFFFCASNSILKASIFLTASN